MSGKMRSCEHSMSSDSDESESDDSDSNSSDDSEDSFDNELHSILERLARAPVRCSGPQPPKRQKTTHGSSRHVATTAREIECRTGVHVVTVPYKQRSMNWHDAVSGDVRVISFQAKVTVIVVDSTCSYAAATVVGRTSNVVCIFSLESGAQLSEFPLNTKSRRPKKWCLTFSWSGKYLAASERTCGNLSLFDVERGSQVLQMNYYAGECEFPQFSPDDSCLYLIKEHVDDDEDDYFNATHGIWKIDTDIDGDHEMRVVVPVVTQRTVLACAISAINPLGFVLDGSHLTVWNSVTKAVECSVQNKFIAWPAVDATMQLGCEDTRLLIGSAGKLSMWDISSSVGAKWTQLWVKDYVGPFLMCGSFSMYATDRDVHIVDSTTGEELDRLPSFVSKIWCVAFCQPTVILL